LPVAPNALHHRIKYIYCMFAVAIKSNLSKISIITISSTLFQNNRQMIKFKFHFLLSIIILLCAGCATYRPSNTNNICSIFLGEPDWYESAVLSQKRWKTPIPAMMAIMHQESRFVADAQPDREWFLGFIPLPRKSSAYGYAQAQDPVWSEYSADGHAFDDRDDFDDAINFIGWYMHGSSRILGISKSDIYSQYLAYHEGRGGYRNKSYNKKPGLKKVAGKVKRQSQRYHSQLEGCKAKLDDMIDGWF
jgi:hypothetical protein